MKLRTHDLCETTEFGGVIAVDPVHDDDRVSWHDLSHVRLFEIGKVIKDTPTEFRFADVHGRIHFLRPLSLELFNGELAERFGGKEYGSREEMVDAARAAAALAT